MTSDERPSALSANANPLADVVRLDLVVSQAARIGEQTFTLQNLPKVATCAVADCSGGGLALHALASWIQSGDHHFYCQGYLGDARGKFRGKPCENYFKVKVTVERAERS